MWPPSLADLGHGSITQLGRPAAGSRPLLNDLLWYKYTGDGESDLSGRSGWAPRSGNRIGADW